MKHIQLLMLVLGIWSQVFMLLQQAFYPLHLLWSTIIHMCVGCVCVFHIYACSYLCEHICVWVNGHLCEHVCGGSKLMQVKSLTESRAYDSSWSSYLACVDTPSLWLSSAGILGDCHACPVFWGLQTPNSSPHTCQTSALESDPSPQVFIHSFNISKFIFKK